MRPSIRFLLFALFAVFLLTTAHAHYDPRQGRFISRDPLGEAGGFNLYAYCGNDPVNRHDPLGLSDWLEARILGDGTGSFAAGLYYVDDNALWWGSSRPQYVGALRRDGWVDLHNGQLTSLSAVLGEVNSAGTDFTSFFRDTKRTVPTSLIERGVWQPEGLPGALTQREYGLSHYGNQMIQDAEAGTLTPQRWDEIRAATSSIANLASMGMLQAIPGMAIVLVT